MNLVNTGCLRQIVVLFCFVFACDAAAQSRATNISMAITFDDLPWVGDFPSGDTSAVQGLGRIAAVLRVHGVSATGFVISNRARGHEGALQTWVNWGNAIGNHSASHPDLNGVSADRWLRDIERCDSYLRKFTNGATRFFRFPYLHYGNTADKKLRAKAGLKAMGLRTAKVTVDNSEWILARAYGSACSSGDAKLRHAIGREFIRHIVAATEHADAVARRNIGRPVRQVLLLHANALVDDHLDALLLALEEKGVHFITLDEALADSVYSLPDTYVGPKGMSWLYRISSSEKGDARWDDEEAARLQRRFPAGNAAPSGKALPSGVSSLTLFSGAPEELRSIADDAGTSVRMRSLLVMHKGKMIAEAYFNGAGPETPINLKSVTKSLTSTLVGIAIRKGWIRSVDDSIGRYLPATRNDPGKAAITIRQLLTMSSGLSPVSYEAIQHSSDWVRMLLAQPLRRGSGRTFTYDTPVLQILSAVLRNAGGMSLSDLAQQELLGPLGGRLIHWRVDARGLELGGNDAFLRPRDLLQLGELYRLNGEYGGRRILPESYVAAATSAQIKPASPTANHGTLNVRGYGYLWWMIEARGEPVYAALGHGGQILLVSPQRELVVLVTSRWPNISSVPHYHHITRILLDRVLPLFPRRSK